MSKKVISQLHYQQLLGLKVLANEQHKTFRLLEKAVAAITGESPSSPGGYYDYSSDYIWGDDEFPDGMLKKLGIAVGKRKVR